MEEEEDDFYGGGAGVKQEQEAAANGDDRAEKMDMSEEEEDDTDSDDDVQFTLEKPEGAKVDPPPTSKQKSGQPDRMISESKSAKSGTPIKTESQRAASAAPPVAIKGTLTHNGKEGKDFPEVRTSKLDINAIPNWPGNGKPITEIDIDADLAENSKPWRLPGTDITDYFNYGFDEYTWTQYCVRQQAMTNTLNEQRQQDAQMKSFFGGGGGGGMPPGMPNMDDFMQQSGMPPEFMQMMMGGGGMPGMGQQGMGGQQGAGGFGSGQNSVSPHPQAGQVFQPPQGPSGGGQQGGFPSGPMEGFSPQQIAIMQQEQQGYGGGGGGGRGRNKRRGW
ncbi:Pre-mRNA polyadenylation factor fip1 [Lecanosticta acicola]|uniref:Pre-mRNA polyadenylation factor fip1 n=1 Tax=Lecanosticta acicola TaxID=111012 RepID=A0AAI8YU37_9PEZI|nr:Pre-mRNA polyadenylation factor fip1 [Lecanosticta acicola]